MWSPKDENLLCLCLGATSLLVAETSKFKNFEMWHPATLNSYKYLKSETHLWNVQINEAFSVNKGIAKICLFVDMVRKNWSSIFDAGCGLHYFVLVRFASFWVFANFSTAERFKYLFFTAMEIHTMARIVKK